MCDNCSGSGFHFESSSRRLAVVEVHCSDHGSVIDIPTRIFFV